MTPKFRVWDTFDEDMVNDIFFSWQDCGYESLNECLSDERWKFMQSTGLFDTNDKEVFERDVVKCYTVTEEGEYEYVGVVCLKDFAFVIVDEKDTYDPLWNYKSGFVDIETEIEIIGNIYENPELVEVLND